MDAKGPTSISFTKDSSLLGVAPYEGAVKLWEVSTLQEISTSVISKQDRIYTFFSPDNQALVAKAGPDETYILDLITGELLHSFIGKLFLEKIALSNDGNILATLSPDNRNIILSDLSKDRAIRTLNGDWRIDDLSASESYPRPYDVFSLQMILYSLQA